MRTETLKRKTPPSPTEDPRLESHWKIRSSSDLSKAPSKNSILLISYADDEGVRLNNGRPGANEGPARILFYLGRMVAQTHSPDIFVLNDRLSQLRLSERHEAAERMVERAFLLGYRVISVGGGHDYGYPDAAAFLRNHRGSKILNVDAHLDVRPVIEGKLNSGTAFSRLIEGFGGSRLIEYGIQPHCNSDAQRKWALSQGVKIIDQGKRLPSLKGNLGLSVCLDAFQGIRGVSAPAVIGLDVREGLQLIENFKSRSKWLGLYECAPRYDPQTEDSARLAARFAYHFIHLSLAGRSAK